MASSAAADSGDAAWVAANTTDQRVCGNSLGLLSVDAKVVMNSAIHRLPQTLPMLPVISQNPNYPGRPMIATVLYRTSTFPLTAKRLNKARTRFNTICPSGVALSGI